MKPIGKLKVIKHLDKLIKYTNKGSIKKFEICFLYIRLVELSKIYCIGKRELNGCKPNKYHYSDLEIDLTEEGILDKMFIVNIRNRNKLVHRISDNLELCEDLLEISKNIIYSLHMLKELVNKIPDDFLFDEDFKENSKSVIPEVTEELFKISG